MAVVVNMSFIALITTFFFSLHHLADDSINSKSGEPNSQQTWALQRLLLLITESLTLQGSVSDTRISLEGVSC